LEKLDSFVSSITSEMILKYFDDIFDTRDYMNLPYKMILDIGWHQGWHLKADATQNLPKTENSRQPQVTPEKEEANIPPNY